jgi:hypothetical protein
MDEEKIMSESGEPVIVHEGKRIAREHPADPTIQRFLCIEERGQLDFINGSKPAISSPSSRKRGSDVDGKHPGQIEVTWYWWLHQNLSQDHYD